LGTKERKLREKNKRRKDILSITKELFESRGLSSTTIEDIAQMAELSPATIYNYFKNKGDLYASLNLEVLELMYGGMEKVYLNEKLDPVEKLFELKNAIYNSFKFEPLIIKSIIRFQIEDTLTNLSPQLVTQINKISKKSMNLITKVYESGVREGIFRKENSIAIADTIWAICTGVMVYEEAKKRINPQKDFFKSTLDTAIAIFIEGLKIRKDAVHPKV